MGWFDVGVTGTQHGATLPQLSTAVETLTVLYHENGPLRIHDGLCIGFDEQILVELRARKAIPPQSLRICGHPPANTTKLSETAKSLCDTLMPPGEYLARDRALVKHATGYVVGAPHNYRRIKRGSGTWYTIAYAVGCQRRTYIVYPSGVLTDAKFAIT